MGLKIDFEFFEIGQIYKRFPVNFLKFEFSRENFLMGLKIDFEFWNFGKNLKRFPYKICIRGFLL